MPAFSVRKSSFIPTRALLAALLATALLAACGGGGGGDDPTPPPPPSQARINVAATTVTAEVPNTDAAATRTVQYSLQNLTAADSIQVSTSYSTNGILSVANARNGAQGTLTITFRSPAGLAIGSYSDTLTVSACRESPCTNAIAGSPHTIAVTYTVTAPPSPPPVSMVLSTTNVSAQVQAYDAAPTRTVWISLLNRLGQGSVVVGGTFSTNGIDNLSMAQDGPDVVLTIPFKSPWVLGPGTYTDTITIHACRESPCQNHIAGSPQVITVTYQVIPAANPPAVTLSATSLSLSADNQAGKAVIVDDSIGITLANAPANVWTRVTWAGVAVADGSVQWTSQAAAKLHLTIRAPSTLGAGTYTGTVQVEVCMDSMCAVPVPGSPGLVNVTYTVTGSALPNTQLRWSESSLTGAEMITAETRSPQMTLRVSTSNLAYGGIYLRHSPSETGLIANVVFDQPNFSSQVGVASGQYAVTLKPPAALGSGVFTDRMEFLACYDEGCADVVQGSHYVLSLSLLISATEGVEFTRNVLPTAAGTATEVVWSAHNQSLYVAGLDYGTGPRIQQVDPVAMTVGAAVSLPYQNLQHMAVTSDASYLYVGSRTEPFVQRLLLPSLTPDIAISLGSFNAFTPYLASDLATLPGEPQSVVVAVGRNNSHGGVYVYDNSTPRASIVGNSPGQAFEYARWLVPTPTPGTFLSQNYGPSQPQVIEFERLAVDATGIRVDGSTPVASGIIIGSKPQRAGSRLYLFGGRILDADTGALLDTLPYTDAYAVLPDEAHQRIFVWVRLSTSSRDYLVSYDMQTLQPLGYAPVYPGPALSPGVGRSIVLWGTDGVALTDGNQLIVLSGPFFSTYRGEPTQ